MQFPFQNKIQNFYNPNYKKKKNLYILILHRKHILFNEWIKDNLFALCQVPPPFFFQSSEYKMATAAQKQDLRQYILIMYRRLKKSEFKDSFSSNDPRYLLWSQCVRKNSRKFYF